MPPPPAMSDLTHFNAAGDAHMVDVGGKPATKRTAVAQGSLHMQPETLARIKDGRHAKGDALGVARIAGIQAAKRASELIPLCHPLALSHVRIDFAAEDAPAAVRCTAICETTGPTGVEMEALVAVQIALLTVYDMCKAADRGMRMDGICLQRKDGGRSGSWSRDGA